MVEEIEYIGKIKEKKEFHFIPKKLKPFKHDPFISHLYFKYQNSFCNEEELMELINKISEYNSELNIKHALLYYKEYDAKRVTFPLILSVLAFFISIISIMFNVSFSSMLFTSMLLVFILIYIYFIQKLMFSYMASAPSKKIIFLFEQTLELKQKSIVEDLTK